MDYQAFVKEQIAEIQRIVKDGSAINALSGGVDSSVVTVLGHRSLGDRLKTVFIENGLMRKDEPERVVGLFKEMGIPVQLVDARRDFLNALRGLTDPEEKRNAITKTFYSTVTPVSGLASSFSNPGEDSSAVASLYSGMMIPLRIMIL